MPKILITDVAIHQRSNAITITQAVQGIGGSNHQTESPLALGRGRFDPLCPIQTPIHSLLNRVSDQL